MKSWHFLGICLTAISAAASIQLTNEWQDVPEDGQVPAGAHIRLDLESGQRQVKLAEPNSDEKAVVVQPPPPIAASDDSEYSLMTNAIRAIEARSVNDDQLENLADLAHDLDYGLTITENAGQQLLDIATSATGTLQSTRELAARAIGAALRNNPKALQVIFSAQGVVDKVLSALKSEESPIIANRLVYLLSSLMGESTGFERFVNLKGGDTLATLFGLDGPELKVKIADFVQDYIIPSTESIWKQKEMEKWSELFQKALISGSVPADVSLRILETLTNLKQSTTKYSILMGSDFMQWISKMATKHSDPEASGAENALIEYAKEVRHIVFGNPKAARKQFDDL